MLRRRSRSFAKFPAVTSRHNLNFRIAHQRLGVNVNDFFSLIIGYRPYIQSVQTDRVVLPTQDSPWNNHCRRL